MWKRWFHLRRGRHAFWRKPARNYPVEIIAAVADANARPENRYLFSFAMNDRNPELPARAFFTKMATSIAPSPLKSPSR
jgi:hypothetical protein